MLIITLVILQLLIFQRLSGLILSQMDSWLRWVLEYTIALSKRQLAQVRGKFVVDSNPAKTNADTLLNEANEKLKVLEEELQTKGVFVASR